MAKYRAFLGDWFEDIEAESEEDAINQMVRYLIDRLTNDPVTHHVDAWRIGP